MHATIAPAPSPAMRAFEAQWRSRTADPLSGVRDRAMQRFMHLGLPTSRDETWRYTNLRRFAAQNFVDAPQTVAGEFTPTASLSLLGDAERVATVLIVNGFPVLPPTMETWINGIEISSLKLISQTDPGLLLRHLEPLSDADQARWGLLNTALFRDGLYLKIDTQVSTPLLLLHVATSDGADNIAFPRIIVEACAGSRAILIEHHVQHGEDAPLCNSATHVELARDAQLEHYRVFATGPATTHMDTLQVRQAKNSRCKQFTIALGGGLVRTSLDAQLNEAGATLESHALLVGHEARHVDCVNLATHNAPHTQSRQTARIIAGDVSRVVFNSKVIVNKGALHAESNQSCRGLLMSPKAEIDTRPQLEIHADEVKCAHGATTGRLDPDMLFYLVSRGIDRETAQSLLVYAFLADVLTGMSVSSARTAIETALIAQLPNPQILRNFK